MRQRSACVATAALLVGGAIAHGQTTVQLSVSVNSATDSYKVYETVTQGAASTLGIFSTDIEVLGSGGITVNPSTDPATFNDLPMGTVVIGARKTEQAGFFAFNSVIDLAPNDVEFTGGQGLVYDFNPSNQHGNIVTGFGIPGTSSGAVGDGNATWGDPALVAEGTYAGTNGTIKAIGHLTVSSPGDPTGVTTLLLPASLPTTSGSPVGPTFADLVNPGSANVGVASILGDVNGDGAVGFDDLVVLAAHYGLKTGATVQVGDFNGDGAVGFDDLVILAAHYGQHAAAADAATVPEPASIGLVSLAATSLLRRRM